MDLLKTTTYFYLEYKTPGTNTIYVTVKTKTINNGVVIMKCFKYKILNGNELIVTNWINRQTKQEAYQDLQQEYPNSTIKLTEVNPAK